MTTDVFLCDCARTPNGHYAGALSRMRADDLAAIPLRALAAHNPGRTEAVEEVHLGWADQAGEDNRNVARMALLLTGLPVAVPGITLYRLCASGLDAVAAAAWAIRAGAIDLAIAGGVESMSRAPARWAPRRLVGTLMRQLERGGGRLGLATMCVGVGQGAALALERVG